MAVRTRRGTPRRGTFYNRTPANGRCSRKIVLRFHLPLCNATEMSVPASWLRSPVMSYPQHADVEGGMVPQKRGAGFQSEDGNPDPPSIPSKTPSRPIRG
jgi:hypothetical protein